MMDYYLQCISCGHTFDALLFTCPICNGLPLLKYRNPIFKIDKSKPGVWRYSLLPPFTKIVSRGEGLTPINRVGEVVVKNERFNPTGTYADRASAVISSYLLSNGVTTARVMLEEDFTASLAYYLANTLKLYIVVPRISLLSSSDLLLLEEVGVELVSLNKAPAVLEISYINPLTVEGLKTIAFEIFEKKVRAENIVVPASTGTLAISLAKGFQELRELGYDHHYSVVAVVLKGYDRPKLLQYYSNVRVEEISEEEVLETLVKLSKMGIKTKALSALTYTIAENLGSSIAVVTMGFKQQMKRYNGIGLRKELRTALAELGEATAYELWKRTPIYTLRGTYKALSSMEKMGEVCSEVRVRGGRKVKYYRLCTKGL